MEKLDLSKIPEKYKKSISINKRWEEPPIEEVFYEANLSFLLKDKDGFNLKEISTKSFTISSGKDNVIQRISEDLITKAIARRTKDIYVQLNLTKCLTSRSQ